MTNNLERISELNGMRKRRGDLIRISLKKSIS